MNRLLLIMVCALLFWPAWAPAQTPEEKGLSIASEADKRDSGFGDFTAGLLMKLTNRHGQTSERKLRIKTLEVQGDGDKSLSIFDTPPDVKGTAFLTFSHKTGDDDQWLYLPALKRVKRISSRNKSGSFMGSEFSYEDIASQEVEKYTYKWLRDETYNGHECYVVERYPVDRRNSGYSRMTSWIDKAEFRALKIDYYDRKNVLLKTLTITGYKKYNDKFWRADTMYMVNHQSGKATRLVWSNYKFGVGFGARDFSKTSLKRAR